ncbi:uncharacterized protein AAES06_011532 isoform 1-T1 [Glossophaga mutica]
MPRPKPNAARRRCENAEAQHGSRWSRGQAREGRGAGSSAQRLGGPTEQARNLIETTRVIQEAFGDDARRAAQIKVWHRCIKDGGESAGSDPALEGPQQAEHPRTLNVCGLQSAETGDGQTHLGQVF